MILGSVLGLFIAALMAALPGSAVWLLLEIGPRLALAIDRPNVEWYKTLGNASLARLVFVIVCSKVELPQVTKRTSPRIVRATLALCDLQELTLTTHVRKSEPAIIL